MKPKKLYKTTVIVWSERRPADSEELEKIAGTKENDANGKFFIQTSKIEEITDETQFPNIEYFNV